MGGDEQGAFSPPSLRVDGKDRFMSPAGTPETEGPVQRAVILVSALLNFRR
jgi:hypothetical protein